MNIVVNGIIADYLSLCESDVDLLMLSAFRNFVPYCRDLATNGHDCESPHNVTTKKGERRPGTYLYFQRCKLVQEHQQQ